MSRRRYAAFLGITMLVPFLLLGAVEGFLRLARPDGGLPLFEETRFGAANYLVANPRIGARWFAGVSNPPSAAPEVFAAVKPERAVRIFVLGESTTAGFPYPRNATFSRLLADVLRDVLPDDSVEVVNLGIAAINSFAMLDLAREVQEQKPDAVLIYAGHNEYYGALGAASRVSIPGGANAVRLYLRLLRLRTVLALRNAIVALRARGGESADDLEAASLMEILARDREVPLGSQRYNDGARQFEANLESMFRFLRRNGTPVFIGSLASNLRDQPPLASDANRVSNGADSAYTAARDALARGDTSRAMTLFTRARDADVVRFRAPSEFNEIIRRVAASTGATYVPVAEAFAAASPGGIPGSNLFLEHVHPNLTGQALIGEVFLRSLAERSVAGRVIDTARMKSWDEYARGRAITPFDDQMAAHTVRTLTSRWPFVPVERQVDYRGQYRPVGLADSLAFAVSRGARWEIAKLQLGAHYEARALFDSAVAEYAGLARDAPLVHDPWLWIARALGKAGRAEESDRALRRAVAIRPTAPALAELGSRAAQARQLPEAIAYLRKSVELDPSQPRVLYQLSLAYALSRDLPNARATALSLARIAPSYPGLAELIATLGLRR